MYNKIGYSITDIKSQGIASISHDHGLRYLNGDEFKCFNRKLYDEWKSCYLGGICELHNFNLNKSPIYTYDINGLYSHVRLKYPYPVGEPEEIENPSIDELPNLFGLIKAIVVEDGKVPFGIPRKIGLEFNRVRGRVYYEGTTEELKNYVRLGAVVDKIVKVLHYKERKEGKELFGESIEVFDKIKREGTEMGNKGKLGHNSGYGKFGLDWDQYGIDSSDNTSLTIGSFIAAYARVVFINTVENVNL